MAVHEEQSTALSSEALRLRDMRIGIDGCCTARVNADHLKRLQAGGVSGIVYTVADSLDDFSTVWHKLRDIRREIEASSYAFEVTSAADFERARAEGTIGVAFETQHLPIGRDLSLVELLARASLRVMQLTYNELNTMGAGCIERADPGLSHFGVEVVAELNRLRVAIEVSHCGPQTTLDIARMSTRPVAATHANPFALTPSPRNKSDEALRAIADTGGVIGLCPWVPLTYRDRDRRPTLDDYIDEVEYVLNLVGEDHIAFGTDMSEGVHSDVEAWNRAWGPSGRYPTLTGVFGPWFQYETRYSEGFSSIAHVPYAAERMLQRGHSSSTVEKFLGSNWVRFYKDVWGA